MREYCSFRSKCPLILRAHGTLPQAPRAVPSHACADREAGAGGGGAPKAPGAPPAARTIWMTFINGSLFLSLHVFWGLFRGFVLVLFALDGTYFRGLCWGMRLVC